MSQIAPWLLGARPKTLTAAVAPILVATALAASTTGSVKWSLSVFALMSAIFIQIGTNLFNDALDFEKGADGKDRLGPVRVTQSGMLPARTVWWAGIGAFAIASLFALPLLIAGGLPILAIGLASLVCGYIYTGGPFPLAYRGLGDFFVLVFFGWVAVAGMFFLQSGTLFDLRALLAGTQVGMLATSLIAINNLRDHEGDRKVDKRTLAVRFGPRFAKLEITALLFIPFLLGSVWWLRFGMPKAALLPLLASPLALKLAHVVFWSEPGRQHNQFLAKAALIHLVFSVLLSVGFWLGG